MSRNYRRGHPEDTDDTGSGAGAVPCEAVETEMRGIWLVVAERQAEGDECGAVGVGEGGRSGVPDVCLCAGVYRKQRQSCQTGKTRHTVLLGNDDPGKLRKPRNPKAPRNRLLCDFCIIVVLDVYFKSHFSMNSLPMSVNE
ncbi:MAG: hypothetical protein JXB48_06620 [Candidatus Latescibacteria bacterium]|nr:hypothetical protein [Candidatus Latescibacterota bacterium]